MTYIFFSEEEKQNVYLFGFILN